MVLRSGCIIPFQFRDSKKLLMIGVPEENRDLSIWDLRNVVRAAFGIYNFEFRNKKIGFNIPDELLLHYLAQRHDLTNFVIEIGLANDDDDGDIISNDTTTSIEPSCSMKDNVLLPQNSNELNPGTNPKDSKISDNSSNGTPPHKLRKLELYSTQPVVSLAPSVGRIDVIPKSEQGDESEMKRRLLRYEGSKTQTIEQQQFNQNHQQQYSQSQLLQHQHSVTTSSFFSSYGTHVQNILVNNQASATQQHHSTLAMNRFRRRGERMSKDQKEIYVKYFEENPCMLSQRRNDVLLEPLWSKLANMLNSVPQGAVKNVEEWKQTFDAWRYRVFMYTRYNSKLTGPAAQNPKNYKPLTPTDQRAYAMWTSHKSTTPHDYEKMDMFAHLDETQPVYDPCKDNYAIDSNCISCRNNTHKTSLESSYDNVSIPKHMGGHSNVSVGGNSQNSQSADEPPMKLRLTNAATIAAATAADVSHIEVEPKLDYELAGVGGGGPSDNTDDSPPLNKSLVDEEHQQEMHFERMQHEFFMQHHHHQQQQQHQQQQMETVLMQDTSGNSLRQRKERMSKKQKEVYVNFLEQNPVINEHRRNDPLLDRYWIKLADILNSVPQGAVKHVAEWKQTFDNWRYRVFLYARYNSKITGDEALNSKSFKPLTHTDKRAYSIWIRNPDTAPPDLEKMRNVFVNLEETQQD